MEFTCITGNLYCFKQRTPEWLLISIDLSWALDY